MKKGDSAGDRGESILIRTAGGSSWFCGVLHHSVTQIPLEKLLLYNSTKVMNDKRRFFYAFLLMFVSHGMIFGSTK